MSDDAVPPGASGSRAPRIEDKRRGAAVDPKLLEVLACPLTKGPLFYDAARAELVSRAARLAYPIRDGVPIMLPSEARQIVDE